MPKKNIFFFNLRRDKLLVSDNRNIDFNRQREHPFRGSQGHDWQYYIAFINYLEDKLAFSIN